MPINISRFDLPQDDPAELPNSVPLTTSRPATAPGLLWAVNVRDGKYGAVGDGVADDTAAVIAAQADARAGNRPLYLPSGTYKLTSQITLQSGERWVGDRWSAGVNGQGTQLNFVFAGIGACFTPFAPLLGFTDGITFTDLLITGDGTNTTIGLYLQSCRYFKAERVWISGMAQQALYTYGQRNSLGLIDGTHPGDCTHNRFISCVFVAPANGLDAVRLGGTLVNTTTTITSDSGATIAVADTAAIFGSTGTIVCADNGEQITFTGKSTNSGAGNLTGCTRAVNGTTQIVHPNGTQFAARAAMGTSNMHTFIDCVFSGNTNSRYGLWVEAGSASTFNRCSVVGCGSDGLRGGWYGNTFTGMVCENNQGYGVHFDGSYESHDNWIFGLADGGTNVSGLIRDETDGNTWVAYGRGLKLANNFFNADTLINNGSLYRNQDGFPRWKDQAGNKHILSYVPRPQLATTQRGVLAETFPQVLGITDLAPVSSATPNGTIYSGLVGLQAGDVVTNIIVNVGVAGAGTAPSLIKLALVSKAGVVLATTADLHADARWTSIGAKVCALSAPFTITADDAYYLAFLQSGVWGTTAMQMWQINNAGGSVNLIGAAFRSYAVTATATDIAGTLTLGAAGAGTAFWLACN